MGAGRLKIWNAEAGVWQYPPGGSASGGGVPDPSGQPDGDVLTVESGAAVWAAGGGSQPIVVGPIPVTYQSANIETTGFPVLDVKAGDIIMGFGMTADTPWTNTPSMELHVTDSSGLQCVNGGSVTPSSSPSDADAATISEVFDGWTLILQDTQLVIFDPSGPELAGAGDLYIARARPVAP